jgi:hypothetical protein
LHNNIKIQLLRVPKCLPIFYLACSFARFGGDESFMLVFMHNFSFTCAVY